MTGADHVRIRGAGPSFARMLAALSRFNSTPATERNARWRSALRDAACACDVMAQAIMHMAEETHLSIIL